MMQGICTSPIGLSGAVGQALQAVAGDAVMSLYRMTAFRSIPPRHLFKTFAFIFFLADIFRHLINRILQLAAGCRSAGNLSP